MKSKFIKVLILDKKKLNFGKTVLAQCMDFVSRNEFNKSVNKYNGNNIVKSFTCWEQFAVMSIAQLTHRESLTYILLPISTIQQIYNISH